MPPDARLSAALARRAPLAADPQTNAYRVIHGAADGFPGLAVDRYASVLVAHVYAQGRRTEPPTRLLQELAELAGARSVYLKYRPEQASTLSPSALAELAPAKPLFGRRMDEVEVLENGVHYVIRPGEGLSTGLFLDMREARARVRAEARGKTILNCFAYTCGFGLAAWLGGAARAANVDVSRHYLDWGRANAERNGLAPAATDLIFGDVFDWLKRFWRAGTIFDGLILDPPSYATTKKRRWVLERDLGELIALATPLVAPGGWLLACANTHSLPQRSFVAQLQSGLAQAGISNAKLGPVEHEPALDFPAAPGEQPYLKICRVTLAKAGGG
jgi:23S rRNA (cytosine1962-C5)-methyltransferase